MCAAVTLLGYVFYCLDQGYQHGGVGIVLVVLFTFLMFDVRIQFYLVFALIAVLSLNIANVLQEILNDTTYSMLFANNFCVVGSLIMGLFAAFIKESNARQRFAARTQHSEISSDTKIFFSHRHNDSICAAHLIVFNTRQIYGSDAVFIDFDSISDTDSFPDQIENAIRKSKALVFLIDPNWKREEKGRDYLLDELRWAQKYGVKIIPVRIFGASPLEKGDLPDDLKDIEIMQSIEICCGGNYENDFKKLEEELDKFVGPALL